MKTKNITKQVFLSYARKDKDIANAVAKELQLIGINVWYDQSISPGANWLDEINSALNESDSMIAILNQHSFSSEYVRNELQHAFFDDRYKNRLLPVLIGSTSDTDFTRLPWVLTKMNFLQIKGNRSTESISKSIVRKFIALLDKKEGRI